MNASLATLQRRRAALVAALSGGAIWLLTHEYIGMSGDGTLYALMALARLRPGAYAGDLFLRYGSQDSFSLFSPIYAAAIAALGLLRANVALLFAAWLVWLTGAWMLTHRLLRGLAGHAAFLAVCAAPLTYDGFSFLAAGEPYMTPRPFAEGLVMIGLAAALSRRWLWAGLAAALALALHPLMALAGLGAGLFVFAQRRRLLWLVAPAGVGLLLALALANVAPFGRVLAVMDPVWFAAVKLRNPFIFPGLWPAVGWARLACDLAPCLAAAALTRGPRRALYAGVAATAAAAVALAWLGGEVLRDVLIVQLQLGRCGWLAAVVRLPALVEVALALRRSAAGRLAAALLAAPLFVMVMEFELLAWPAAVAMALAGLALALAVRARRAPALSRALERRLLGAVAILPLAALGVEAVFAVEAAALTLRLNIADPGEPSFLPARLLWLLGFGSLVLGARRRLEPALAVLALAFLAGALTWDVRTPWNRYLESGRSIPVSLPAGAPLLWGQDAADSWFLAGRPAWVSQTQSAGLLFSRPTAIEWLRRRAIAAPVVAIGGWSNIAGPAPRCVAGPAAPTAATLQAVCRAAPDLGGIVLDAPPRGVSARMFATPAAKESLCRAAAGMGVTRTDRFWFVACAPLRADPQAPGGVRAPLRATVDSRRPR